VNDFLESSTLYTPLGALLVLLAPILGSFIGVLIARVPSRQNFIQGRSQCASCGHELAAFELVPIASFVALRGKCRHCHAAIPWRDFVIEVAAIGVTALACLVPDPEAAICGVALGQTLLALAGIDFVALRLPDFLTLPLVLAGLFEAWFLEPEEVTDRAIAAALGYLVFRAISETYRHFRGRAGLGEGDAKLLAAGGAWLGVAALPYVVLIGAGAALVYALVLAMRQGRGVVNQRLPFGPFLAAGIFALWLYRLSMG